MSTPGPIRTFRVRSRTTVEPPTKSAPRSKLISRGPMNVSKNRPIRAAPTCGRDPTGSSTLASAVNSASQPPRSRRPAACSDRSTVASRSVSLLSSEFAVPLTISTSASRSVGQRTWRSTRVRRPPSDRPARGWRSRPGRRPRRSRARSSRWRYPPRRPRRRRGPRNQYVSGVAASSAPSKPL